MEINDIRYIAFVQHPVLVYKQVHNAWYSRLSKGYKAGFSAVDRLVHTPGTFCFRVSCGFCLTLSALSPSTQVTQGDIKCDINCDAKKKKSLWNLKLTTYGT